MKTLSNFVGFVLCVGVGVTLLLAYFDVLIK
jgi:hypothetical protein